jgi:hypothetical protein
MVKKIAFCFLLYTKLKHGKVWEDFFSQDLKDTHSIYSHIKTVSDSTQPWIKKHKVKSVKTGYCEVTLVYAWIQLLKEALKDKDNKYFCLLSDECIALFNYKKVYEKIVKSKKSRINPDMEAESYIDTGLYWADQWVILNRKHAELLTELTTTAKGKKYVKETLKQVGDYCPDEIIPINWFSEHYGAVTSSRFKKEFNLIPSTYTYWDGVHRSPVKFTSPKMKQMRKKICTSKAVFGRKFNAKSARLLSMDC